MRCRFPVSEIDILRGITIDDIGGTAVWACPVTGYTLFLMERMRKLIMYEDYKQAYDEIIYGAKVLQ
jgi:hypothetical protein